MEDLMRELRQLRGYLESASKTKEIEQSQAKCDYVEGLFAGEKIAYNLAAKWMGEIIDRWEV